ncbi:MAG: PBP1A family penicillin-binding protein [Rhodospirillales bacterium]
MAPMGKARKTKSQAGKTEKTAKKLRPAKAAGGIWRWPFRAAAWALGKSLKWGTVAAVWGLIVLLGLAAWYGTDLPDVEQAFDATRRPTVTLLAADGRTLATIGDVYGPPAGLDDLPKALTQAVLATEDRRFYDHFGLDIIGLGRAMAANIRAGRIVQGGSTITQQVAKNLFLTPERTLKRKIQELLLALWLEHRFSKDQILTIYLNRVYLGAGTYGVAAAAEKYFNRPASRLSTYQSAMLAGLLKAPSRYNPLAHPARARARTAQVLKNMVAAGVLAPQAAEKAKASRDRRVRLGAFPGRTRAGRHFADWVLEQVSAYVNPGDRDIVVRTTLDPDLQDLAETAVKRALDKQGAKAGVSEAALVAMGPTGAVRAMVGGRDHSKSQFNRATQAKRQPGSAFKPFVYLAGLEAGLRPGTLMVDGPVDIGGWRPRNFSKTHQGQVTLAQAMARSINTVAVKVSERAGRARVIDAARRLGLSGDFQPTPSLALGVSEVTLLELTQAYGPFANGGAGVWAYGIEEIKDRQGNVLYRRGGSGPGRVVSAGNVKAMNAMLSGVVSGGTGRAAQIGRPQAGKTGTSQNFRDAWFVGFTAHLLTGVWMGNDDGSRMKKVTGGGLPARVWRDFMAAAHTGTPPRPLPGLKSAPAEGPDEGPGDGFWKNFFATLSSDAGR